MSFAMTNDEKVAAYCRTDSSFVIRISYWASLRIARNCFIAGESTLFFL